MSGPADVPAWLVVPLADLLSDLWRWPGNSEFLDIYVARPLLASISAQAAFKPTEIGGYLLGRHYVLRDEDDQDRHVVIIINSFRVEGAAGAEEFSFGAGSRARDLKSMAEVPELRDLEIVGWYHSHHNRGTFLSPAVDQPIHRKFFPEPYQLAYVLDLVRRQAGFFIWEGPELLAGPGQCLAAFDPTSLEVSSTRKGRRRPRELAWLKRFVTTWNNESLRDGVVAVAVLLVGLAAFVYAFGNRPFLAWTRAASQTLQWEGIGGAISGWAIYRSTTPNARPSGAAPFARLTGDDRDLDLAGSDRNLVARADRGKRYWYRVAALGADGKPFRWSRPVPVVVPIDQVPAAAEGRAEVADARDKLSLRIGHQKPGIDTMGYWLIREGPLISRKRILLNGGKPLDPGMTTTRIADSPPEPGAYRYLAIPQDWSGNLGQPWDSAAIALSGRQRLLGLF